MENPIELRQVESRPIAAVRFRTRLTDIGEQISQAFGAVMAYLGRHGVSPSGPAVSVYVPVAEGEFDVAAGFFVPSPIDGDGNVVPAETPAGEVACLTHMGPYESLPQAYEALQAWMQENGREPDTTMWEEYHSPPETPPAETRTDIYWPLRPR